MSVTIDILKQHKLIKSQLAAKLNITERFVQSLANEIITFAAANNNTFTLQAIVNHARTNANLNLHNVIDWNLTEEQQLLIAEELLNNISSLFAGTILYKMEKTI